LDQRPHNPGNHKQRTGDRLNLRAIKPPFCDSHSAESRQNMTGETANYERFVHGYTSTAKRQSNQLRLIEV
jgi:hypothetical protein